MTSVSQQQDKPRTETTPTLGASADPVIIGESPPMLAVMKSATRVADSTIPVLIQGESGTGKDLVARFIHDRSRRREGPFVSVNCAAIPEHLLESELFGHEMGAFTGAVAGQVGQFERASGGTLFLDEIGDMNPALQAKVVRAIQEREVERVGGDKPVAVDVRLVAATNRNLEDEVTAGRFSEDLYYRLAVIVLTLPPLRKRGDDVRMLAERSVTKAAREHDCSVDAISQETLALLRAHPWPGNVSQLLNVMEQALRLADGRVLLPAHLPPEVRFPTPLPVATRTADRTSASTETAVETLLPLAELERRHIRRALSMTGGHLAQAAESLGIHRNTLRRKLQEYGIEGNGHGRRADMGDAEAATHSHYRDAPLHHRDAPLHYRDAPRDRDAPRARLYSRVAQGA